MNGIDLIALFPIAYFFVVGFRKGLVKEIFSILGLILGILISLRFTHFLLEGLTSLPNSPLFPYIAYIIVFMIVLIMAHLVGKAFEKLLKITQLNIANKIAGGFLGLGKVLLLLGTLFWLSQQADILSAEQQDGSFLFAFLAEYTPKFLAFVSDNMPLLNGVFAEIEDFFQEISKSAQLS